MTDTSTPAKEARPPRPRLHRLGIVVDFLMLALILVNLALIIFDWLYAVKGVQYLLSHYLPAFLDFYSREIHSRFTDIDLTFVTIYLIEFGIQWGIAIWQRRHHRWFFYPFIHWYDLLGCIPVGSFRWLRLLRVVSILFRLQKLGWVKLDKTYPGQVAIKYYHVLVEEISDRVVVNVLEGAQREIEAGSPVLNRVQKYVLAPRKEALLGLVSAQIVASVTHAHQSQRAQLERYLGQLADGVIRHSPAMRQLEALPVAGRAMRKLLREQVQEIGLALVDQLVNDISATENRPQLNAILDSFIKQTHGEALAPLLQEVLGDIIEQIKVQVAVQQWKLDEAVVNARVMEME